MLYLFCYFALYNWSITYLSLAHCVSNCWQPPSFLDCKGSSDLKMLILSEWTSRGGHKRESSPKHSSLRLMINPALCRRQRHKELTIPGAQYRTNLITRQLTVPCLRSLIKWGKFVLMLWGLEIIHDMKSPQQTVVCQSMQLFN